MQHRSREIGYAFGAIVVITVVYLVGVARLGGIPAASDLFGHSLGILGFVLMLMTETLYSLRKRSRRARWGRMSSWLRFHIFTGLVGPYLVLLHTSWKFNGLAGIVTALTVIVVLSGTIGRYIYTAVPRTADGLVVEAGDLEREIAAAEAELARWSAAQPELVTALTRRLETLPPVSSGAGGLLLVLGHTFLEWSYRLELRRELRHLKGSIRVQARQLERLLRRRRTLQRQAASLAMARRMLATWHSVHIPIGVALFTTAFVHVGAALYYATLLK